MSSASMSTPKAEGSSITVIDLAHGFFVLVILGVIDFAAHEINSGFGWCVAGGIGVSLVYYAWKASREARNPELPRAEAEEAPVGPTDLESPVLGHS